MLKRLFILTALLLSGFGLYAQSYSTTNDTIKGANGAMTVILRQATAGYPEYLTQNGRYLSGVYGGAAGYVYDFEKDTCIIFLESTLAGYFSPSHYAGQNDPGDTYAESYVYNGQKIPLEKVLTDDSKPSWKEVSIFAVQDNGDRLVTMVYNSWTQHNGYLNHYNRAAVYDGKTGKCIIQLPFAWDPEEIIVDEDKIGFGSRGDCISADGAIIGGHSTNPNAKSNWSLAFWDISDLNDIQTFGLEGRAFDFGSFYGASSDGSLLAGGAETKGYGVILHYNRQLKEIEKVDTISPLPSWDFLTFADIADDGTAIGYCGMNLDPGTREAIVYTELTGVVKMTDFLYEYYDIDVRKGVDLYTPMRISRNGKRMVGFNYESPVVPYSHELSDIRILPRARKISARAARGLEEAYISWQEPLISTHLLTGYNIYRDDEETPLNTEVLPTSQTTYTDNTVQPGKHTYYIEAVYSDGKAMKQSSNQVQVVGKGVAFPVQAINHRVDYNRFATIYWGVPSSEVVALAMNDIVIPNTEAKGKFEHSFEKAEMNETETATKETMDVLRPKSYLNTTLDYIANVDMLTYSGRAAVKIGDNYYTTSHTGGGIKVIDRFNEVVKTIHPNNLGIVLSMVYLEDKQVLYCGTSKDIKELDLTTEQVVMTYPIPAAHLAYIPDMKDGKPGLVAGNAHSCNTYLWNESKKDYVLDQKDFLNFASPLYAMGSTYYKGRLYVGSASGPYYNEVYVYDFATRKQIGDPIQVVEDPALYNLLTQNGHEYLVANMSTICQPGSLSICELEDGTTALGMVFQCNYMTSRFMLLELESAETVEGYNLYRSANGGAYAKVNDAPMTSRRYAEVLDKVGKYTYYVVVKSANGAADSEMSPVDTLTITDPGKCPEPNFTVKESNNWPFLQWMPGSSENQALVGFDLYRDNKHIERFWLNDMRLEYIDDAVSELGTYKYRLETLYQEGCVAAKEASVTLTGEGTAQGPFGLTHTKKVNNDKATYRIITSWETPMFEEPLTLKYCNAVQQPEAIGFDNYYECWGLIGWRKSDLDLYRDLYLVGMEYLVGTAPLSYEAIVIINDEQVYKQSVNQIATNTWRTVWFDKSFSMDQTDEVAVGFHTKYSGESVGVLLIDPTVTKNGKSNILSLDGFQWSTLQAGGMAGSWLLGALVVHKRDLEAAKKADGTIDHIKLAGSVMRMALEEKPLSAKIKTLPNATFNVKPSAKAPLKLTGFNVYRKDIDADGSAVKLNDALLTSFTWTDSVVTPGAYDYEVAAVYADGKEAKTSIFIDLKPLANEDMDETLDLNVYPNPATEWINVEGEYETLQIFDFGGRLLRTQPAANQIQIGDLTPGTYVIHFIGADARKAVYKIVVR